MKRRLLSLALIIGLLVSGFYATYYYFWIWNPLISDEEMIAHFQAHRAEFDELAKRYREYPGTRDAKPWLWHQQKDIAGLLARAGINRVDYSTPIWLPDPYSPETAKTVREQILAGQGSLLSRKYGALQFTPVPEPRFLSPKNSDRHRSYSPAHNIIWKDYSNFPEVPRIEDGQILMPLQVVGMNYPTAVYHEQESVYTNQIRSRTLPSLNRFPDDWKDYECVYRKLNSQWFIRMCNGH